MEIDTGASVLVMGIQTWNQIKKDNFLDSFMFKKKYIKMIYCVKK